MRPTIICHMMSSVDGRIVGNRWTLPHDATDLDIAVDSYFEISNQMGADAEMLGRKTVQTDLVQESFDHSGKAPAAGFDTFLGAQDTHRKCIVLDPKGKIRYRENTIMGENIVVILGESVSQAYLEHLRELGISYLFAGANGNSLHQALGILGDMGIKKIVLQGGGIINGTFLKAGLIDELSLMIYPGVDGLAGVSCVFEYLGKEGERPANGHALELTSVKQLPHGVVWLRYRFHASVPSAP